jgi:hypothetical protein
MNPRFGNPNQGVRVNLQIRGLASGFAEMLPSVLQPSGEAEVKEKTRRLAN